MQHSETFNNIYAQAREARALAQANPDTPAAQQWHLIADSLFEAVALYDKMVTAGNKLPCNRPQQKTM